MKQSRKAVLLGAAAAVLLVAVAFAFWTAGGERQSQPEAASSAGGYQEAASAPEDVPSKAPENPAGSTGKTDVQPPSAASSTEEIPVRPHTPSPEPVNRITFPYAIPGTNLVVYTVAGFDGIFLEDGSDEAVSNITAMLVENTGSTGIEYAMITAVREGTTLEFEASAIPGGAAVLIQEKHKTPYQEGEYRSCGADVAELGDFTMSQDLVALDENEDGSLSVTNLTGQAIPCVRIFYKSYMDEESVYVGGITYNAKLTDLEPGECRTVAPSHYAGGYSRVVMVRTYDTVG